MATSAVATASRTMMIPTSLRAASMRQPLRLASACCRITPHISVSLSSKRANARAALSSRRPYSTDSADKGPPTSASTKPASSSPSSSVASNVLERYRSRLEKIAEKEGVSDIDALREAYAAKIEAIRRRDAVLPKGATEGMKPAEAKKLTEAVETAAQGKPQAGEPASLPPAEAASPAAEPTEQSSSTDTPAYPSATPRGSRPLSSLLDLEKVRTLPAEELTAIWRLRFASDPFSLCAVIPAHTYAAMEAAARARPQFVLPVPHPEQGAEIHFLQWAFDTQQQGTPTSTVLFTQLAEYKVRGEYAQPHTTLTHYTDLAVDCGLVLMQGQVSEGRGVTADQAQWLAMCLQRFYGAWDIPGTPAARSGSGHGSTVDEGARARRLLLQWFAAGDSQFSIERLLEEVEKLV